MTEHQKRILDECTKWLEENPDLEIRFSAETREGEPDGNLRTWVLTGRRMITFVHDRVAPA